MRVFNTMLLRTCVNGGNRRNNVLRIGGKMDKEFDSQLSEFLTREEFVKAFRFSPERLKTKWKDYNKWGLVWLVTKKIDGVKQYAIFTSED